MNCFRQTRLFGVLCLFALLTQGAMAQDLEPRRWTHLPVGANFFGAAYAYTDSAIIFQPAIQIENATSEVSTAVLSYVRALDVFGKSGRIDVLVPYSHGRWEGTLQGQPASTRRSGFNDPRLRFSVNLLGSPAQRGADFQRYKVNTIVGAALEVVPPLGEYDPDKFINLGNNRWTIRPQMGVVHNWNKWAAEITGSVWFFTANDEFVGMKRQQDELYSGQAHVIYTFRPGLWASVSAAYGYGAESTVDGVELGDTTSQSIAAASLGVPIDRQQGLKFSYLWGKTYNDAGSDYQRLLLAYSVLWGGK